MHNSVRAHAHTRIQPLTQEHYRTTEQADKMPTTVVAPTLLPLAQVSVFCRWKVFLTCNYPGLAVPLVLCTNQGAALKLSSPALGSDCKLVGRGVKWLTEKREIPDKTQSPEEPWSPRNEESDGVWVCWAHSQMKYVFESVCARVCKTASLWHLSSLIQDL